MEETTGEIGRCIRMRVIKFIRRVHRSLDRHPPVEALELWGSLGHLVHIIAPVSGRQPFERNILLGGILKLPFRTVFQIGASQIHEVGFMVDDLQAHTGRFVT